QPRRQAAVWSAQGRSGGEGEQQCGDRLSRGKPGRDAVSLPPAKPYGFWFHDAVSLCVSYPPRNRNVLCSAEHLRREIGRTVYESPPISWHCRRWGALQTWPVEVECRASDGLADKRC